MDLPSSTGGFEETETTTAAAASTGVFYQFAYRL